MTPILAQPDSVAPEVPAVDVSLPALNFVHDLLLKQASNPPALEQVLGELARVFGATAAGLAGIRQKNVIIKLRVGSAEEGASLSSRPWEAQPELLSQVCKRTTAVPVTLPDGRSFLLAAYCSHEMAGWLL